MRRLLWIALLLAAPALAQPFQATQFLLRYARVHPGVTLGSMGEEGHRLGTAHIAYLKSLVREGRLVLAGQSFDGNDLAGIMIVNASSRDAALEVLNNDPLVKANFVRGEVFPFHTVMTAAPEGGGEPPK
jgi:uncharacterized protein YciI